MRLVSDADKRRIEAAIAEMEKQTDGELVVVLAARSDDYRYIPTLWAAIIALVLPAALVYSPWLLDVYNVLTAQFATFIALALLLRTPRVRQRLIPRQVRQWRAANMARRQFLENNLHHTRGDTGALLFLSEEEHYAEILVDRGISQHIDDDAWAQMIGELVARIKQRQTVDGLLHCIEQIGEKLKSVAPATAEKDELPNHLVIIN